MNTKGLRQIDVEAIEDWLYDTCIKFSVNSGVEWLLKCSLGRIAANRIREEYLKKYGEGWSLPFPRPEETRHIVDWIVADFADGAPWLGNLDDKGRPKKLMKCADYEALLFEADKAMDRKFGRMAKTLGPDDERTVMELADGYTVVQLLTPEALDLESERMHHCVGQGAYDAAVREGTSKLYSLRDRKRRPVVTIEVALPYGYVILERETETFDPTPIDEDGNTLWTVEQVQGRRNNDPSDEHMKILGPFAAREKWSLRRRFWPTVTDVNNIEYYLDEIPSDAVFKTLSIIDATVAKLPDGLTILGDAYVGRFVNHLPENMTVGGNLILASNDALTLPESLQVGGEIRVWHEADIARPIPAHLVSKMRSAEGGIIKKLTGEYTESLDDILNGPFGGEDRMILSQMSVQEEINQIATLTFLDEIPDEDNVIFAPTHP